MFSSDDSDSTVRFVLGLLFGIIAIVVGSVVGLGVWKAQHHAKAGASNAAQISTQEASATSASSAVPAADSAAVVVENGVVKFYFATGKADIAAAANEALAEVVKGIAAGKHAQISGFHDSTGDLATNEELAKQRALAVRAALTALGVAEDKINMVKPEVSQGSGSDAQARRVEVTLVD